jgi:hypothetical protein
LRALQEQAVRTKINLSSCECSRDKCSVTACLPPFLRLDHWFMSNTSFGPPLSSLDPTQMVSMSGPVYNPSLLMGDSVMQDVPLNPSAPGWDAPLSSGEMLDANGVPVMNGQGMMPHPDQSLAPPGAMGVGYDVNRGMTGPVNGQMGQGGQWGDGNSVQYWNTLVDRKCPSHVPSAVLLLIGD